MVDANGTGPRLVAGPLFSTQRIHHWIGLHPGCTRDEIEAAALALGMVDRGHAHRRYASYLNSGRAYIVAASQASTTIQRPRLPEATPATVGATRSDTAVRFMVKICLNVMAKRGSLACVDGRYTVLRPLKPTGTLTLAQVISDPAHTSRELKRAEALRAFRLEWAQFTSPRGKLTWKARRAIIPWLLLELKMVADTSDDEDDDRSTAAASPPPSTPGRPPSG